MANLLAVGGCRSLRGGGEATLIAARAGGTPKTLHFRYKSIWVRAAAAALIEL